MTLTLSHVIPLSKDDFIWGAEMDKENRKSPKHFLNTTKCNIPREEYRKLYRLKDFYKQKCKRSKIIDKQVVVSQSPSSFLFGERQALIQTLPSLLTSKKKKGAISKNCKLVLTLFSLWPPKFAKRCFDVFYICHSYYLNTIKCDR